MRACHNIDEIKFAHCDMQYIIMCFIVLNVIRSHNKVIYGDKRSLKSIEHSAVPTIGLVFNVNANISWEAERFPIGDKTDQKVHYLLPNRVSALD